MTNINVRVVGTANVTQMTSAFAKVQAQVAATNAQLASMVDLTNGVDPAGYQRLAAVAAKNDKAFRNAVASTGMFEQMQLRINKATDDYVDALNKQKLSFRDMAKQRKVAAAAYKEQLRMEQMVVRQSAQSNARGKQMLDVMYPKAVSADLDTAGKRLAFFNSQLKSGANQMLNWGKNTQWAGRQLMVGLTMPIAAFGAAAGVMAYKVDQELTRIRKVYDSQTDAYSRNAETQIAYEKEMAAVREAGMKTAIDAAKRFGAAGTDTLNVQAELAATGLQGAKLQESTNEVMRIAALGELEYADAIAATISMQSVFRMSTEELAEAFNYINAVENATSLQTKDFAAAIPIAAAPVKAFGGDIKELGILLTAMKERGIEATQGANAIKAAMQRLGRPSKQVQEEWQNLTNTDITKLFDDSTSLIDLFQRISDATADLSNKDKIKAFAGLFGTYQVTRMSALVEGMQDLRMGVGQVSEAARQAEEDAAAQARKAKKEEEDRIKSISGQWDAALQTMKLTLTEFGEPFLQIATKVVNAISWIMQKFNELPHGVKVIAGIGITLAALAGPIIMLVGLFANLSANALKGVAGLTGLAVRMELLSSESRAAKIATDLVTAGFVSQTTAVQQLTAALGKLAISEEVAQASMLTNVPNAPGAPLSSASNPFVVGGSGTVTAPDPAKTAKEAEKAAQAEKRRAGYMAMGAVSAAAMAYLTVAVSLFGACAFVEGLSAAWHNRPANYIQHMPESLMWPVPLYQVIRGK